MLSLLSLLGSEMVWLSAASVGDHFLSANLTQPHMGAWKQPPSSSTKRSAALTGRRRRDGAGQKKAHIMKHTYLLKSATISLKTNMFFQLNIQVRSYKQSETDRTT